jgi:hypothetical protein
MRRGLYVLLAVLLVPTVGLVGDVVTDGKFRSTLSSSAPIEVASTSMVANLNADMVDGIEGTDLTTVADVEAIVAAALENVSRRKFYLSDTNYPADTAETSCATGYHFASVYEILDPSHLQYAVDEPDARTNFDSGEGPPSDWQGWIRTGNGYNLSGDPGVANCAAWSSTSAEHNGTVVWLSKVWKDPTAGGLLGQVGVWVAIDQSCDSARGVWCIED